ncbi:MAG: bifunctional 4-hydroxy-2-oxoglutarate aldolase/2-dehydro-3-deoxy-phosphogluconate aldolase, partial [Anaerolineae bacterium]|jgi:2-dehydro-3-deoxyphosphogluconate aldolase/(4S)-4-hydroxy-2-oxoglutarate aldolase|nr:bifunctional 4-hydroxy-2-oxoglutarate aldolase/2-dehydro-3-deoxy-phosphogluconate aldolase [Anaerolineae bacterium]
LLKGGLPCAEITFRTSAAAEAIKAITDHFPDMLVGAGTVLNKQQAKAAIAAGAKFIVSPGLDKKVVQYCQKHTIPVMPGIFTATELQKALKLGIDVVKFFPAEASGGVKTLKALSGPFPQVKFMPTGGISAANLPDYLALPQVVACGGSWLVKKSMIAAGEFDTIEQLAREALALVHVARGKTV